MDILKSEFEGFLAGNQKLSGLWKIMVIVGAFLALFGIVFSLQGDGVVGPSSSFMYNSATWIYTGAGIAVVGLIIFLSGIYVLSSDVKQTKKAEKNAQDSLNEKSAS